MKKIKKLLCMLVVAVLAIGLVACSSPEKKEATAPQKPANDPKVEAYVKLAGDKIAENFNDGFEGSAGGLTCKTKIRAEGTSIVLDCLINDLDNVPEESKAQMHKMYDASEESLKTEMQAIKDQVPTLTSININVCEEDGDKLASIDIEY